MWAMEWSTYSNWARVYVSLDGFNTCLISCNKSMLGRREGAARSESLHWLAWFNSLTGRSITLTIAQLNPHRFSFGYHLLFIYSVMRFHVLWAYFFPEPHSRSVLRKFAQDTNDLFRLMSFCFIMILFDYSKILIPLDHLFRRRPQFCIMEDQVLSGFSGTKSMLTPPASLGPIFFTIFLCSGCLS